MDANEILKKEAEVVEKWLYRLMPDESTPPVELHSAMRYSVFAGGKRLRPVLAVLAYRWAGGASDVIYPPACALELIHTYSLIHDDLPSMDNDDLRRGKPTSHMVFGEAMAILAGDALHAMAFELLAMGGRIEIITDVAKAIGTGGLVGGQVYDLEAENIEPTPEIVEKIHLNKTAALLTASLRVGAIMADTSKRDLHAITEYGKGIGLAFQIIDDILDIVADQDELGKNIGSDIEHGKTTYPAVYGIERSREIAKALIEKAKSSLPPDKDNSAFNALADFIFARSH
jgi:geranylgeranyl diphosphate synthase type II